MGVTSEINMKGYFRIHKMALKINGISLDGYHTMKYKIYSVMMVCGVIIMYPILDFFELFKHNGDERNDVLIYATAGLSAIAKTLVMIKNRHKIGKVLRKLEEKPFLPDPTRGGEAEKKLVNECILVTTVQTYVYWIVASSTVVAGVLFSLVKRMLNSDYRVFPYGPFAPFDTDITDSFNYQMCWIYQVCSISGFASAFVNTDLLICAVLAHISYQFRVLHSFIKQTVEISYRNMVKDTGEYEDQEKNHPSVIPYIYLHKTFKTAVEYHVAIVDLAADLETTFSTLLLLTFLCTLVLVCISIYNASMTVTDARLIRYIGEIASSVLQVGLFCYWGEQVTRESQKVGFAAYESNFVGADVRFQKDLSLMIRRSQTSTVITAGKFTNIGLPTFAWILRTSYSAFMVLRRDAAVANE